LCKAEKVTPWVYEDDVCYVCYCKTHLDKLIVVLKRHTAVPSEDEVRHLNSVLQHFPNKKWRGPQSIKDHFHWHEI